MAKAPAASPPSEFQPMGAMKIVRAFAPGDVIFIECDRGMTAQAMEHVNAQFKRLLPDLRIVILQHGMKMASREETSPWIDLIQQWREMLDGAHTDTGYAKLAQSMDEILVRTRRL